MAKAKVLAKGGSTPPHNALRGGPRCSRESSSGNLSKSWIKSSDFDGKKGVAPATARLEVKLFAPGSETESKARSIRSSNPQQKLDSRRCLIANATKRAI